MELQQIEHSELKSLRQQLYDANEGMCPILRIKIPFENTVVDHQHKTKAAEAGVNGGGLIRGAIDFRANAIEGKITNAYKRVGLENSGVSLPTFLRNLADYLEKGTTNLIHPNEKVKVPVLKKSVFNKLKKLHAAKYPKRKPLEYMSETAKNPRPPKMSKRWEDLLAEFDLTN